MEKKEIVDLFLKNGLVIDEKALDFLFEKQDLIPSVIKRLKREKKITVSLEDIKFKGGRVEVLKKPEVISKEKVSISDYLEILNSKFLEIRKILEVRMDLVNLISINKIGEKSRVFSVIGMIVEKDKKTLRIEDQTGEIELHLDESLEGANELIEDEVIGVLCKREDSSIFAKKIIFPDIPLNREIGRTREEIFALFISDLNLDRNYKKEYLDNLFSWLEENKSKDMLLVVVGNVSSRERDIKDFFSFLPPVEKVFIRGKRDAKVSVDGIVVTDSPSFLRLENVIFLGVEGSFFLPYVNVFGEDVMVKLLKKRDLKPKIDLSEPFFKKSPYLIDWIPDIFVSGYFEKPKMLNYKGTTIISNGNFINEPIFWLINLKTRECLKVNFS